MSICYPEHYSVNKIYIYNYGFNTEATSNCDVLFVENYKSRLFGVKILFPLILLVSVAISLSKGPLHAVDVHVSMKFHVQTNHNCKNLAEYYFYYPSIPDTSKPPELAAPSLWEPRCGVTFFYFLGPLLAWSMDILVRNTQLSWNRSIYGHP
ncbi:hypothetical protein F5Y04DRAFT_253388 [Hypomontagnella monticulosa]|nr:hypothetical protein F5Y04DRAFT_253388 [Hypomontagnella monticulosa]